MKLTEEVKELLCREGAGLVGVGDISQVPNCGYKSGVAIAVPIPKKLS